MKQLPAPWSLLVAPAEPALLQRQEKFLILINLTILTGIAVSHLLLGGVGLAGPPGRAFFALLMAWFMVQALGLVWLHGQDPERHALPLLVWASASIWVNLGFSAALALSGGMEDTHTVVLLVVPVVAAAFRYTPAGIALVVLVAVTEIFLQLWVYYRHQPTVATTEYFEATNAALACVVVALVVASVIAQLRRDRERLQVSFVELEATRDRLVHEEKLAAIGRLAGAIAHEVRNPVAMIVSALGLATAAGTDQAEQRQWCVVASDEARRLEGLTRDFLTYARQKDPDRQPTSLAATLGYVAGLARAREAETGVRLAVECDDDAQVLVDPYQLHQALLNMVVNAFDATPAGGRITLGAAAAADGGAELFVENEGQAIPADIMPRLFEPFFTTRAQGTGLGLAIARTIARAHGGDLELSANLPRRVRFTLRVSPPRPQRGSPDPWRVCWWSTMKRTCAGSCARSWRRTVTKWSTRRAWRLRDGPSSPPPSTPSSPTSD